MDIWYTEYRNQHGMNDRKKWFLEHPFSKLQENPVDVAIFQVKLILHDSGW